MKTVVIGSGRMGLRHAGGALKTGATSSLCMVDVSAEALAKAKESLSSSEQKDKVEYRLSGEFRKNPSRCDVVIIAATVDGRMEQLNLAAAAHPAHILIEKPLGQSMSEAEKILERSRTLPAKVCVNLNMRLYPCFRQLRSDLLQKPQLKGPKVITVNTGSIGIGANGIHYLDLLFYLLDAAKAELVAGEIEEDLIPSGRGPQYGDFGGWCTLKFFGAGGAYNGRAHLSLSASSSVFGGWDIVAPHGRITLSETEMKRVDTLRKEDSAMPVNRYAADYLPPAETNIEPVSLQDITARWLEGLAKGEHLLPSVADSLPAHRLMFEWLGLSKKYREPFPFT